MNTENIINAIEAEHYDYEPSLRIPGLQEIRSQELILRISDRSTSIFTNKVVRSDFRFDVDEKINKVIDLYKSKQKSFAWWIGQNSKPDDLSLRLISKGFALEDTYIGLALSVKNIPTIHSSEWLVKEALTEKEIREHVSVNEAVWGMDNASVKAAVGERMAYLALPDRGGGYIVAYNHEQKPIGNGTFRISSNGQTMYLIGSAVLPQYRNRGVYHALLQYRFNKSIKAGCEYLTVQARKGTSEPILRRLGFEEYCKFDMYVKSF